MQNKLKKMLGMKRADIKRMKKSNNFTLLELLIVVAILAIIAGGVVGSFTNAEENAAQSQAARDIAAVDQAVQTSVAIEGGLPDNVDSLIQIVLTPTGGTASDADGDYVVQDVATEIGAARIASAIDNRADDAFTGANDGGGLSGKVGVAFLTETQVKRLQKLGLTKVRYIDANLDDNDPLTLGTIPVFGNNSTTPVTGEYLIDSMDIPQNYFNAPRGNDKNRGRGFAVDVSATAATIAAEVPFAVWEGQVPSAPVALYDNTKLGANPDAVLVAFGLGPDCSLVGKDSKFGFSSGMPYYANVKQNEYNNYVMLVDVNQNPAKVVAVIDTKGDFRAEEFSEYNDQKL